MFIKLFDEANDMLNPQKSADDDSGVKRERFLRSHDNKDKITLLCIFLGYKPCSYAIKFYDEKQENGI